jgi:hypothetical protein
MKARNGSQADAGPAASEHIQYVFAGTGGSTTEAKGKCDDECVGGTANTKAMEATQPD